MRHKIDDDKKKVKSAITINSKLADLLDKHLLDKEISNRSKYIEGLIRADLLAKGHNVDIEF